MFNYIPGRYKSTGRIDAHPQDELGERQPRLFTIPAEVAGQLCYKPLDQSPAIALPLILNNETFATRIYPVHMPLKAAMRANLTHQVETVLLSGPWIISADQRMDIERRPARLYSVHEDILNFIDPLEVLRAEFKRQLVGRRLRNFHLPEFTFSSEIQPQSYIYMQ